MFWIQLPKGAKLLAKFPTPQQYRGGAMVVEKFIGRIENDSNEVDPSMMSLSQIWGIPWGQQAFTLAAVAAGHPVKLSNALPDILKKTVESVSCSSPSELTSSRAKSLKFWIERAKELSESEAAFQASLHPGVRAVLRGKRLLLFQEMLKQASYYDMDVCNELTQGATLTGEAPRSGLWPSKFTPASMTEQELMKVADLDRPGIVEQLTYDIKNEQALSIWNQTMQETETGALAGPRRLDEVSHRYPLSRRFGVIQNGKLRCINDFTRSGVNSAAQTCESPKPHTLDVVASLASYIMLKTGGRTAWSGRAFDLTGAYRQCAVHPDSYKFSHIAVANPSDGRVYAFCMKALPFGSVRSVHAFLRLSHAIWYCAIELLQILWCSYFDDFVTFCPTLEADSVTNCIHTYFRLIGWRFAESGAKAPPFNTAFTALGVKIDIGAMQAGHILFDNTEKRVVELVQSLDKVLSDGALPRQDALRLRGRLQFACSQLFGRLGKAALSTVTDQAYRSSSLQLQPETCVAMKLFRDLLTKSKPRKISGKVYDEWFVFTDASFEPNAAGFKAGVGAVLVDKNGRIVQYVSEELPQDVLIFLMSSGKKTIIFELEMLAIVYAMTVWESFLRGSHVVFYTDNNAVRDAVIACSTSSSLAMPILDRLLKLEYALDIFPWYTRVPTDSNVSDDPSRGVCDFLDQCQAERVPLQVCWLDLVKINTGGSAPSQPTWKRCSCFAMQRWFQSLTKWSNG